jgi:septal ring factor EnvC (AmiA/AmiB activator)
LNVQFQLHFRSGIGGDARVTQSAQDLLKELDDLNRTIKEQSGKLEAAIAQVEQYQLEVQQLRQQIVQVEQQLRAAMAPTHLLHDRDQAVRDQQVGFRVFPRLTRLDLWMEVACTVTSPTPSRAVVCGCTRD